MHLRWQADRAACQVAWLLVATGRVEGFENAAQQLGSDHWQPVVAMAETAPERSGKDAAARVFAAANRPGLRRDYLAEHCHRLTGRRLRHLHVIEAEVAGE